MKLSLGNIEPRDQASEKSESGELRKKRSSQTLTFVFFVGLAFFFWVLQRMQGDVVRTLYIPLVADSLTMNTQPIDSLPRYLMLEVQDQGFEHIRYSLDGLRPIHLRMHKDPHKGTRIGLERKELTAAVVERLSPSAVVLRQSFQELSVRLKTRSHRRLPLRLESVPSGGAGFTATSISLQPDSITVYGDEKRLDALTAIRLPNRYNDITTSFSAPVPLVLDEGLETETREVHLVIEVEELTEQSFTLPLALYGVPEGHTLHPLPNMAMVQLTIPRSKYGQLIEGDVELSVRYTPAEDWELEQEGQKRTLPIRLSKAPKWVKRYSITPERVQFVLEK